LALQASRVVAVADSAEPCEPTRLDNHHRNLAASGHQIAGSPGAVSRCGGESDRSDWSDVSDGSDGV